MNMNVPLQLGCDEEMICPECHGNLLSSGEAHEGEHLKCTACGRTYPVLDGVPHFARELNEQKGTANSFGFAWKAFWGGFFDKGQVFGLQASETAEYFLNSFGITPAALRGAKVLDAGTGSGRIPMALREQGCCIYAVDIHDGLGIVAKQIGSPAVRVNQADLLKLPFRDAFFDYVWSSGVIHHTPDSAIAFRALARKVKPEGRLFLSVYSNERHHYRLFRRLLPFSRYLPPTLNYVQAALIGLPLYCAFNGILYWVRLTRGTAKGPHKVLGFTIEDTHHKPYLSIVLNLFDQLHPEFQREHSVEEVRDWFETNGFRDIVATNTVGMVEMRGIRM